MLKLFLFRIFLKDCFSKIKSNVLDVLDVFNAIEADRIIEDSYEKK